VRRLYLAVCNWISPVSPDYWNRNVVLANSDWTAGLLREKYGIEPRTLYPPVGGDFPSRPFLEREKGFVCLGRISPEKRVDAIIEIISRVRQRGHSVHLHILGGADDSPYGTMVKKLAARNKDWVFLEGWTMGQAKQELLAGHRYGIHGRENEPFGIAVAEMVNAGCIVFVPKGGGQTEIVNHPDLTYESDVEAVAKIDAVLAQEVKQEKLCEYLRAGSDRFSVKTFVEAMRGVIAEFVKQHAKSRDE
jgi:glycosyltransferase involved in cell wall biosynthesis